MEELTAAICEEYRKKALALGSEDIQDIGARRKLKEELQTRCGISEIWALNIINGHPYKDYLVLLEHSKKAVKCKKQEEMEEFLEWQAEKEEAEHIKQLILEDEKNK